MRWPADVRRGRWALLLVCLFLGLMLSLQVKTQRQVVRVLPYQRLEDLTSMLYKLEEERDKLREEVAQLRSDLSRSAGAEAGWLRAELDRARMAAGLVPVAGPGVRVILDDSGSPRQPGEDPNLFILHDDDVLRVVNELAAAGAEAMAINGQRLVGVSEIRCSGPTISINGTRTAPPLEVLAIGDPATLESALRLRGGVVDSLALWGIQVRVSREAEVHLPAYQGSLVYRYARPKGGGG
ncbi:MAG: DUF881 domain-containing protein [Acetobacteraceae bacterium]|nr:DUF881 domain-containing protein [Acetobacteraceae bacterium]